MQAHFAFDAAIKRRAGKPDHDHHHADVNDVAAVPPRVAPRKQPRGREEIAARLFRYDAGAAQKLRDNRGEHRGSDREGHDCVKAALIERAVFPRPHADGEANNHRDPQRNDRQNKVALDGLER